MIDSSSLLEILDSLETHLLDMEEALDHGKDATGPIHFIFQKAHNLKSGLGLIGLAQTASLVHALEDLFDQLRKGTKSPHSSDIDFCMRSVDAIRVNLESSKEDPKSIENLLAEAQRNSLRGNDAPSSKISRYGMSLTSEDAQNCDKELSMGASLYRVDKYILLGLSQQQYEELPILQDITNLGKLISVHPKWEEYKVGKQEQVVKFLFATQQAEEELRMNIFDPLILQEHPTDKSEPIQFSPTVLEVKDLQVKKSFLIVDDDRFTALVLQKKLDPLGHCIWAKDGREAWGLVRDSLDSGKTFDCILLDLMLPFMTGREVLANLRSKEESLGIQGLDRCKVLIISALGDLENITGAFKEQADGYLVKPFTLDKVLEYLKKFGIV